MTKDMRDIEYFYGLIQFDMNDNHPDWECVTSHNDLTFADCYRMDSDYWGGFDHMKSHILEDLALVAFGGYPTPSPVLKNVKRMILRLTKEQFNWASNQFAKGTDDFTVASALLNKIRPEQIFYNKGF